MTTPITHVRSYDELAADYEACLADNAALRRIVGLAKEMRSVMLPVDAEDDEILRRFDAAILAGKKP